MNQLDALKQFTTVVADTGDFRRAFAADAVKLEHLMKAV